MKKILILSDWYLPGYKAGGPIRSLHSFVQKMKAVYSISILTGDTDFRENVPYPNIEPNIWIETETNLRIKYISKEFLNFRSLKKQLLEEKFDFIYINSMFSMHFTILPLIILRLFNMVATIIIAPRGMLQEGALQNKKLKKGLFLLLMRMMGIHMRVRFQATDEQEKKDIAFVFGNNLFTIIAPNFVSDPLRQLISIPKLPGKIKMVYISLITIKKNLTAIFNLLSDIDESVDLDIFGPIKDDGYWFICLEKISSLKQHNIHYMGPIPNNQVSAIYNNYQFFILPTLGENFGHAIFEALSSGTPVIISDRTPWKNLEAEKAGWDIPLETPEKFVSVMQQCIDMDQAEYEQWSRGAHQYALNYARDNDPTEKYLELFS
ncbi:MAG: glycosyltransferase [Ignavibacteriales bacterium]|nr:glycosyltransferase [Ignavibacteriales bacterium]